jgi:hypothetical protein
VTVVQTCALPICCYQLAGSGYHQNRSTVAINWLGVGPTKPALQLVLFVWAWVSTKHALQLVSINVHGEYCPEIYFAIQCHLTPLLLGIVQCKGFGSGCWLFYWYVLCCVPLWDFMGFYAILYCQEIVEFTSMFSDERPAIL